MSKPIRIGLTGGIASGKSTVADMFADLGIAVIDTDLIAREVVQPGQPALIEIRSIFGDSVFNADGTLDRSALRQRIFSDDAAREQLESILHPLIQDETIQRINTATGSYIVVVVPLLANSPLREHIDRILVVDCDAATQIERLLARDAETVEQARRILAAQASREQRLAIADDVIDNNSTLAAVSTQVSAIHDRYIARADLPAS